MPKFIELPPPVARRFVQDMRAFHAEENAIKRDEIAGPPAARVEAALTIG
jgi:hypothetical protein